MCDVLSCVEGGDVREECVPLMICSGTLPREGFVFHVTFITVMQCCWIGLWTACVWCLQTPPLGFQCLRVSRALTDPRVCWVVLSIKLE